MIGKNGEIENGRETIMRYQLLPDGKMIENEPDWLFFYTKI